MESSIWQRYRDRGVQVLAINPGEGKDVARQFKKDFGLSFPVLVDRSQTVYRKYRKFGLTPFPLDYIIDARGVIRYFNTEYRPRMMQQVIEELLTDTSASAGAKEALPASFRLGPVHPSPLRISVLQEKGIQVELALVRRSYVTVRVVDVLGRTVAVLEEGLLERGEHNLRWRGLSRASLAAGVYFIDAQSGTQRQSQKFILLP